jgi:hypothetical protein
LTDALAAKPENWSVVDTIRVPSAMGVNLRMSNATAPGFASFADWTAGRELSTIGTNFGSEELPFQGWQRFKEAFAPELVEQAVTEAEIEVGRVVDPFGGSGTTGLAAQFLGVAPVLVEVNPYLADLARSKLHSYDLSELASDTDRFLDRLDRLHRPLPFAMDPPGVGYLPATFVEPGVAGRWMFSKDLFQAVSGALWAADSFSNEAHRRLFRILIAGSLVPSSNVRISGKGRRYRAGWEGRETSVPRAIDDIRARVARALKDIERYGHRAVKEFHVIRGDSRVALQRVEMVDLAVFSPPYPNSFDYTDVYNIELWMLGYLRDRTDNRELRLSTLSSHVQVKREYAGAPRGSDLLDVTVAKLADESLKLWSQHLPAMVGAYFADMTGVLSQVRDVLRPKGEVWMVVGDSRYGGVDVPVASILSELAVQIGFSKVRSSPFRSMRTSPQQGGHEELAETLIVLRTSG